MKWIFWTKFFDGFSPRSVRLFFLLAGTALFLGLYAKLTKDIFEHDDVEMIDRAVLLFSEKVRISELNGAAVDLTALGSPIVITIVTIGGLLILWRIRDHAGMSYLAAVSIGAGLLTSAMKYLIDRERPQIIPRLVEVSGQSYPSGHSLAAAAVYLGLTFLACQSFRSAGDRIILFSAVVCLIGAVSFSRVYLGVHYPSDVASGVFLGSAWTLLLTGIFSHRRVIGGSELGPGKTSTASDCHRLDP